MQLLSYSLSALLTFPILNQTASLIFHPRLSQITFIQPIPVADAGENDSLIETINNRNSIKSPETWSSVGCKASSMHHGFADIPHHLLPAGIQHRTSWCVDPEPEIAAKH